VEANSAGQLAEYLPIAMASAGAFLAAIFAYKGKGGEKPELTSGGNAATQIVAATFTERGQMERLTSALVAVELAVRASNVSTDRLVELLEAEAQLRHDQAVIRDALRQRGIVE
jgi:hypothetical protein